MRPRYYFLRGRCNWQRSPVTGQGKTNFMPTSKQKQTKKPHHTNPPHNHQKPKTTQKKGSGELQASQSHSRAWKNYGANSRGSHFQAHGRTCFSNLTDFYEEMPGFADAGSAAVILHSNLSKAFDTVSSSVLVAQLGRYKLVSQITRCVAGLLGSKVGGQQSRAQVTCAIYKVSTRADTI